MDPLFVRLFEQKTYQRVSNCIQEYEWDRKLKGSYKRVIHSESLTHTWKACPSLLKVNEY